MLWLWYETRSNGSFQGNCDDTYTYLYSNLEVLRCAATV